MVIHATNQTYIAKEVSLIASQIAKFHEGVEEIETSQNDKDEFPYAIAHQSSAQENPLEIRLSFMMFSTELERDRVWRILKNSLQSGYFCRCTTIDLFEKIGGL